MRSGRSKRASPPHSQAAPPHSAAHSTIHAAAAVLALRALATPERRWLGLLLGGGLAIKLALERGWSVPIGFDTGWGFNVVFAAHLSGAIAGALLALGLNTLASMRPARRHHS